jgi:hypothetical protein
MDSELALKLLTAAHERLSDGSGWQNRCWPQQGQRRRFSQHFAEPARKVLPPVVAWGRCAEQPPGGLQSFRVPRLGNKP